MKLSAPIHILKRQARILSRESKVPLHEALDRIAAREGFGRWSLLAAQVSAVSPASKLYSQLRPGDLVLLASRPGQGKTLLGLELALTAMKAGHRSVLFSLEYTFQDCRDRFQAIGADLADFQGLFEFDGSDAISAHYIARGLATASPATFVLIDYLQLLDQKRETPELGAQVRVLKALARERGLIMAFISQVDRSYDPSKKPCPDLEDVRLPNPLDLGLFDRACFMQGGEVRVRTDLGAREPGV